MPRYTLEDISLCDDFSRDPVPHKILSEDQKRIRLDQSEYYCGLKRGEVDGVLSSPKNTVYGRADFLQLLESYSVMLSPTLPIVESVRVMFQDNAECDITKRQRYDEVFAELSYDYSIIPFSYDGPIFVCDPISHEVTRFDKPSYAQLPMVTLSLNPCHAVVQFYELVGFDSPLLSDDLYRAHITVKLQWVIPLPFYYRWSLPDTFPQRRIVGHSEAEMLNYERTHLASSSSSPLGKRSRSESEHSDLESECDQEYDGPYEYPPLVDTWLDANDDSDDEESEGDWCPDDDLGEYAVEPVRSFQDALSQGDAWVDVMQRRSSPPPSKKFKSDRSQTTSSSDERDLVLL